MRGLQVTTRDAKTTEKEEFPLFKTGAFNHSATHPCNELKWLVGAALATNRELQPDCNRQRNITIHGAFLAGLP
jgi:hypothetical protein